MQRHERACSQDVDQYRRRAARPADAPAVAAPVAAAHAADASAADAPAADAPAADTHAADAPVADDDEARGERDFDDTNEARDGDYEADWHHGALSPSSSSDESWRAVGRAADAAAGAATSDELSSDSPESESDDDEVARTLPRPHAATVADTDDAAPRRPERPAVANARVGADLAPTSHVGCRDGHLETLPTQDDLDVYLSNVHDSGVQGRAYVGNLNLGGQRHLERLSFAGNDEILRLATQFFRLVNPDIPRVRGGDMLSSSQATRRLWDLGTKFRRLEPFVDVTIPLSDAEKSKLPEGSRHDVHVLRAPSLAMALGRTLQSPHLGRTGSMVSFPCSANVAAEAAKNILCEPLLAQATQACNIAAVEEWKKRADIKDLLAQAEVQKMHVVFVPSPFGFATDGARAGVNAIASNRGYPVTPVVAVSYLLPESVRACEPAMPFVAFRSSVPLPANPTPAQRRIRARVDAEAVRATIVTLVRELVTGPALVMRGSDMACAPEKWKQPNVLVVHCFWLFSIVADMLEQVLATHSHKWRHVIPLPLLPVSMKVVPGSYCNLSLADPPDDALPGGQRFKISIDTAAINEAINGLRLGLPGAMQRRRVLRRWGLREHPDEGLPPLFDMPLSAVCGPALLPDFLGLDPTQWFRADWLHCFLLGLVKKDAVFTEMLIRTERTTNWDPSLPNPRTNAPAAGSAAHVAGVAAAASAWNVFVRQLRQCRGFNGGIKNPRQHFKDGLNTSRVVYRGREYLSMIFQLLPAIGWTPAVIRNDRTRSCVRQALRLLMEIDECMSNVDGPVEVEDVLSAMDAYRLLVSSEGPLADAGFSTGKTFPPDPVFHNLNWPKVLYCYSIFETAMNYGHHSSFSCEAMERRLRELLKDARSSVNWNADRMLRDLSRSAQLRSFLVNNLQPAVARATGREPVRCFGLSPRRVLAAGMKEMSLRGLRDDKYGRVLRQLPPTVKATLRASLLTFARTEPGSLYFEGDGRQPPAFQWDDNNVMLAKGARITVPWQDTTLRIGDVVRLASGNAAEDALPDSTANPSTACLAEVVLAFVYNDEGLYRNGDLDGTSASGFSQVAEDSTRSAGSSLYGSVGPRDSTSDSHSSSISTDDCGADDSGEDADDDSDGRRRRDRHATPPRLERMWRRGPVRDMPGDWAYFLVLFYDAHPGPGCEDEATRLTAMLDDINYEVGRHSNKFAVRTLMNRLQRTSYGVVRLHSVLSKVWERPFFAPGASDRARFITLRYT